MNTKEVKIITTLVNAQGIEAIRDEIYYGLRLNRDSFMASFGAQINTTNINTFNCMLGQITATKTCQDLINAVSTLEETLKQFALEAKQTEGCATAYRRQLFIGSHTGDSDGTQVGLTLAQHFRALNQRQYNASRDRFWSKHDSAPTCPSPHFARQQSC